MSKILVIGAGLTGSTIARKLADVGHDITIVEARDHVAGNAYDKIDNHTGIRYHVYGPHLFHTSNQRVVDFILRFAEWSPYFHRVQAITPDGQFVVFPPNRSTCGKYNFNRDEIIDIFFRPYTRKMWGMELEEIDPSVINRVPIDDDSYAEGYFTDTFQALPHGGYAKFVENMLDHDNIKIHLNITTKPGVKDYDHIFNSAPIDQWYSEKFGPLEYRSIEFIHKDIESPRVFPTPTVNFTHDGPYTRVTEWSQLPGHGSNPLRTLVTYERPCNDKGRFYPVKDVKGVNKARYKQYAQLDHGNMTFIGRCGRYVYIDMDQAINQGLQTAEQYLQGKL